METVLIAYQKLTTTTLPQQRQGFLCVSTRHRHQLSAFRHEVEYFLTEGQGHLIPERVHRLRQAGLEVQAIPCPEMGTECWVIQTPMGAVAFH